MINTVDFWYICIEIAGKRGIRKCINLHLSDVYYLRGRIYTGKKSARGSVAKRLNNASGQSLCLSTLLSLNIFCISRLGRRLVPREVCIPNSIFKKEPPASGELKRMVRALIDFMFE